MFRLVVLSAALAVVAANPNIWGAGLVAPLAAPFNSGAIAPFASPYFTPIVAPVGPVPPIGAPNYRGPLSLAPGQPANILGADGRPLDTLSVNLDRAVHFTARAVEANGHRLQKRSIVTAPIYGAQFAATNLAGNNLAAANWAGARLRAATLAAGPLTAGTFAAGPLAAGPLTAGTFATGPLAIGSFAATPLTLGRSWVGLAPQLLSPPLLQ